MRVCTASLLCRNAQVLLLYYFPFFSETHISVKRSRAGCDGRSMGGAFSVASDPNLFDTPIPRSEESRSLLEATIESVEKEIERVTADIRGSDPTLPSTAAKYALLEKLTAEKARLLAVCTATPLRG